MIHCKLNQVHLGRIYEVVLIGDGSSLTICHFIVEFKIDTTMKSIHWRYQMRMMMSEEEIDEVSKDTVLDEAQYIRYLAEYLIGKKTTMNVKELCEILNWNGFRNTAGIEFTEGQEINALVQSTYQWLLDHHHQDDAVKVAFAYKKMDGSFVVSR